MMKKLKFLLLFGLTLLIGEVRGQDYIPLAVEDAQWVIRMWDPINNWPDGYYGYFIKGDTVINSINYKIVYKREFELAYNPPLTITNEYIFGAVRDDIVNRKVYGISFIGQVSYDCAFNEEFLLHDFSLTIGDSCGYPTPLCNVMYYNIIDVFYAVVYDVNRKVIQSRNISSGVPCYDNFYEGIGNQSGLFEPPQCFETATFLDRYCIGVHCIDDLLLTVKGINENVHVSISPNPFTDFLTVNLSPQLVFKKITLKIYNITGKILIEKYLKEKIYTVNTKNLQKGIYFFTIQKENQIIQTGKIIKL